MTTESTPIDVALAEFQSSVDPSVSTWPSRPSMYTRANANDQWPRPVTPLTQDLIVLPQERGVEEGFSGELGISSPAPDWTWNGVFYGWVTFAVEPSVALADNLPGWSRAGLYADYFGVKVDPDAPEEQSGRINPLYLARVLRNSLVVMRRYPKQSTRMADEARGQLRADLATDWSAADRKVLVERLSSHSDLHRAQRVPHGLASVISAAVFNQCVDTVTKLGVENPIAEVTDAVSGLGGVHLAQATNAMREVAQGVRTRADFVREFGFRGTNEFELASRPWAEDDATLDRLIQASGKKPPSNASRTRDAARARLAEAAGWRWRAVRWQLNLLEHHMLFRENGKIPLAASTYSVRLVVREAARRLVEEGRLAAPDDVFYLRLSELLGELEGRPTFDLEQKVATRRRTRELAEAFPLPEIFYADDKQVSLVTDEQWRALGVLPPASLAEDTALLLGLSGAQGQATGRARVVDDPNEVDIEDGDILVAAGTDSAWTPLFMQAAAVVVDVGGPMSHSAIAAREVGIPCVVNVKVGTSLIKEGQQVTVDGSAGTVTLH